MEIRQRPLLVWAAAFTAGIGLGAADWLPLGLVFALAALGIGLLAMGRAPVVFLAGLLLLGVSAGALRLAAFRQVPDSDVSHEANRLAPVTLTGTIVSDPEARRGGRIMLFLRAERLESLRQSQVVTGDVSVTLGPEAARGLTLDDGDQLTLRGTLETPMGATNPGAFSWRDYLARRAVYSELRVSRPGAVTLQGASRRNPYIRLAWAVRHGVLRALQASLPPAQAAALSGILIGRRSDLPPDLLADFVHTGTVHVLASAGLHVGIVAFWLQALLRRLTLPRKAQAVLLIACLWLYALMCGGRPSVTRAVAMATLYFGAILFEREPDGPTAIGAAALLILLEQPTALLEPGFQLSFLTILTLALTMPVWESFWRPRIEKRVSQPILRKGVLWTTEMIGLSLLAQLGALPIVAASYNEVSLSGWLANLLVVPALFVLIPLSFAGAAVWGLWHAGGAFLLAGAGRGMGCVIAVVRVLGETPWAYRALPPPPPSLIVLYYLLVYGGTDAIRRCLARTPTPPPAAAGRIAAAGSLPPVGRLPPPGS